MAERRMGIEKVKMPLKHVILSDNQTLKKKKKSLPALSKTLVNVFPGTFIWHSLVVFSLILCQRELSVILTLPNDIL